MQKEYSLKLRKLLFLVLLRDTVETKDESMICSSLGVASLVYTIDIRTFLAHRELSSVKRVIQDDA